MRPGGAERGGQRRLSRTQRPGSQRRCAIKKRNCPGGRCGRNRGGQGNAGASRYGCGGGRKRGGCCCQRRVASRSIDREVRGYRVGDSVPRTVKSESRVASASRYVLPRLAGLFAYGDVGSALRYGAIPGTGDGLSVGKAPGQRPVAQGCASGVLNGN